MICFNFYFKSFFNLILVTSCRSRRFFLHEPNWNINNVQNTNLRWKPSVLRDMYFASFAYNLPHALDVLYVLMVEFQIKVKFKLPFKSFTRFSFEFWIWDRLLLAWLNRYLRNQTDFYFVTVGSVTLLQNLQQFCFIIYFRKSTSSSATRNRRRPRPDEKFRSGSPSRPSRRRPATRIKKSDGATRPVGSRRRKSRNRSKLPVRITRTRSRRCCCVTRNDPDRRRRRPPSRRTTTATVITSKSSFPRFVNK